MNININGVIIPNDDKWIYEWFEIQSVCPQDVERQLEAAADGEQVDVFINSPGGSVYDGSQIYTALRGYTRGDVKIHITGIAASAASVIACAAWCEISPTAQMMIHCASCGGGGNRAEHLKIADLLDVTDRGIAYAYRLKTGRGEAEILEKMSAETYFSAEDALEFGIVDAIMFADSENNVLPQLAAVESGTGMLPKNVIEKLRAMKAEGRLGDNGNNNAAENIKSQTQAKLNLLKLGGARK